MAGARGLGALGARGEVLLAGGVEGGLEVLAQQGGRARLDVALLGTGVGRDVACGAGGERGLVRGKDEGGPLRDDLGEAGGALPAAGEGADAVDAAKVGQGGEAVGDGGSGVRGGWLSAVVMDG